MARFVSHRYPQLLAPSIRGIPLVTVLFNPDGTVARSNLQFLSQTSGTVTATEMRFERWGLRPAEVQDVGELPVQLPHRTAYVVFGTRSDAVLDRELVERYFAEVLRRGVPGDERLWILFDHVGHVRKSGAEGSSSADVIKTVEHRYPGIRIEQATVTAVTGRGGRPLEDLHHEALQLNCLWLAADSPAPAR